MTAADRINANRPTATQVINGADFYVSLDLEPIAAGLIQDIVTALKGREYLLTVLANNKVGSPEHTATRAHILGILAHTPAALTVTLGQDQADALANDLWEATTEPDWCDDCGQQYATDNGLCEPCARTADCREAHYAQIRAVGL
jgi:hypothetical protein